MRVWKTRLETRMRRTYLRLQRDDARDRVRGPNRDNHLCSTMVTESDKISVRAWTVYNCKYGQLAVSGKCS